MMKILPFTALLALSLPSTAAGQVARTLDRGSFTISISGQRVGREDFTISGTPGADGMEFISRATVVMGENRLTPSLRSDSTGNPVLYEVRVRGTSGATEQWMGGITRGRVSARINTPRGASEREYVVAEGAVLLDDDVFHQYHFVASRATGATVTVVIPRRNTQMVLKVTRAGSETISVAGTQVTSQHLIFTEPSGATREVWVDSEGRVLKVTVPGRNIVAIRDEVPTS
jgi:hypothetical protein